MSCPFCDAGVPLKQHVVVVPVQGTSAHVEFSKSAHDKLTEACRSLAKDDYIGPENFKIVKVVLNGK